MTKQEKAFLESAIQIIKGSQHTGWTSGSLDQWSEHAKNMRAGGNNACQILKTLVDTSEEQSPSINSNDNELLTLE